MIYTSLLGFSLFMEDSSLWRWSFVRCPQAITYLGKDRIALGDRRRVQARNRRTTGGVGRQFAESPDVQCNGPEIVADKTASGPDVILVGVIAPP
jgi:hypothetical protein